MLLPIGSQLKIDIVIEPISDCSSFRVTVECPLWPSV